MTADIADVQDDVATIVSRAYRLILGRAPDPAGAAGYEQALREGHLFVTEFLTKLATSDEFANRMNPPRHVSADDTYDPELIDPAELIRTASVEELAERAEGYFRAVGDPAPLLAKPFANIAEAPDILVNFGTVLRALRPLPGMSVLDFGAGVCWSSRFLTQLGCRVIALDVSATALELGRKLYADMPVSGEQPEPEFLVFDGRRFDLPDASVDRVLSFDAFHHIPNPAEALREMARVLRPGGIAAFSEPGDRHSRQPRSQFEMRHFGILENDIVIDDVWKWAREAGFAELKLAMCDVLPQWVDIETYHRIVHDPVGDPGFGPGYGEMRNRLIFWLRREGTEVRDSRDGDGLNGELAIDDVRIDVSDQVAVLTATCRAHNPGPNTWLPSDASIGGVCLGARLRIGDQLGHDLAHLPLPGSGVAPGETVTFPVRVTIDGRPEPSAVVEFDLISERVAWFSVNGTPVVTIPLSA